MVETLLIQNKPSFKNKEHSIELIEDKLSEIKTNKIDLIVLPEMCLIGYKFKDRNDIIQYCEPIPTETIKSFTD